MSNISSMLYVLLILLFLLSLGNSLLIVALWKSVHSIVKMNMVEDDNMLKLIDVIHNLLLKIKKIEKEKGDRFHG